MHPKRLAAILGLAFVVSVPNAMAATNAENGHGHGGGNNCEQQGNHQGQGCHSRAAVLAFGIQPSTTATGAHITPAPTVRILDRHGKLTNSTARVTVALPTNPGGGTLSGTTTVAASLGTATFADLSIDKPGSGYTLSASSPGLTGATSSAFGVTTAAAWSTTGNMTTARAFHTATLLLNGKVLVAGGISDTSLLASAELYDPVTGTWSTTGSMAVARRFHTATLLSNGKVLVAGAFDGGVRAAELYDPATGTWSMTGSMAVPRSDHSATRLLDGKVLVTGGETNPGKTPPQQFLASAELYDPTSGNWSMTGSMTTARQDHSATLLLDGKVLVAAGEAIGQSLASAELYDPATGTWSTTGSMATARGFRTATLLLNGKVLVAGGSIAGFPFDTGGAELYDPATGTWSTTGSMAVAREAHRATLLLDGKVLVAAGNNFNSNFLSSAELYDPTSGTWSTTASLANERYSPTATLLSTGQVLVAGGLGCCQPFPFPPSKSLASAELYR